MLSAIPSPSSDSLNLGPLEIRYYGLCIALAVIAVVLLVRRRLSQRDLDPDNAVILAWVAVPAGLVGARLYHVITDWRSYQDNWLDAFKIWEGGLGIPGGIAGGVLAGAAVCRYHGWSFRQQLDIVGPALLLGQAIGRLGNWFNQELFGRPTDLPWGLEIEAANVPDKYRAEAVVSELTFHPTFLYEALWNLGVLGVLLWLDRQRKLPAGHLFACYVLGYASGRIWIELLRVDPASELFGVRVNVWVMSVLWLGALAWLVLGRAGSGPTDITEVFSQAGVSAPESASAPASESGEVTPSESPSDTSEPSPAPAEPSPAPPPVPAAPSPAPSDAPPAPPPAPPKSPPSSRTVRPVEPPSESSEVFDFEADRENPDAPQK